MADEFYSFPCGCKFKIIGPPPEGSDIPLIDIGPDFFTGKAINYGCKATWDLICTGYTLGVFQVEKPLGRHWCKEIKPTKIDEFSAIGALLRPACLKAYSDGKNLTQHYSDRKNGKEPVTYIHDCLKSSLGDTYGVLVYQESALRLATEVAGFSLADADLLRIAIGKKKPEEMSKMKVKFIDGAARLGIVSKEVAEEIFGWIEKGQRYSFNKCLTGDTIILKQKRNKNAQLLTIEESYKIRTDIKYARETGHLDLYKKWSYNQNYSSGYSLREDGRIYKNIIEDIRPMGTMSTYRISTETGRYIEVTKNHKFPIRRKNKLMERQLRYIKVDDELIICGEYDKTLKKYGFSDITKSELRDKQTKNKGKRGFQKSSNNPGYTNGSFTDFKKYKKSTPEICLDCSKTNCRIEVHHIDGDRTNSKPENLEKLCASCHKKKEYKAGRTRRGQKGYPICFEKIISIEYIGEKECYDVTMAGPYHNFVTDQKIVTCNSHSVSYAINGFWTAYLKAHFPIQFFTSYLRYSLDKADSSEEVKGLVSDARLFDISVKPPDLRHKSYHFTNRGKNIIFGLLDIKGIGEKKLKLELEKLQQTEDQLGKSISKWSYLELLIFYFTKSSKSFVEPIIKSGAVDWFEISRKQMLYDYGSISELTDKEVSALQGLFDPQWDCLADALEGVAKPKKDGGIAATKTRVARIQDTVNILRNPTSNLDDDNIWKSWIESQILGLPLTASSIDINTGICCLDIIKGDCPPFFSIAVQIDAIKQIKTKKGNDMMFVTVSDYSGASENFAVFSQQLDEFSGLLFPGNAVLIDGKYEKQRGSVAVQRVKQI